MATTKKFKHLAQIDSADCGPTCLRMVAKHFGKDFSPHTLLNLVEIGKDGVNLLGIAQAAEGIGLKAMGVRVSFDKLAKEAPLPFIAHWGQDHFVVVYDIQTHSSAWLGQIWGGRSSKSESLPTSNLTPKIRENRPTTVYVADPAMGLIEYTQAEFESKWASTIVNEELVGIALLLEPTAKFKTLATEDDEDADSRYSATVSGLFSQVLRYRSLLLQVGLGLLAGSLLQLMLPFLTKSVVDVGIQTRNLHFVYLVLGAQLALMTGRMSVEFIRSWILLHISTRVNLSILSDFLAKLLRLPIAYFQTKTTGDIMQRIGDHRRIEQFLTGTSLNVLFSMFNLVIFSFVLAYYSLPIFWGFCSGVGSVCGLDSAVSQTPPRPRPQAVCVGGAKPKQPHAAHCFGARAQTQQRRTQKTLGVGKPPSTRF